MLKEHGPLLGQIFVQVTYGTMFLITRAMLVQGMSHYIYIAYRQTFAILAIAPFAFFFERMEKVDLSRRGQAKVVGTVACVAGAMTMTLFKGPQLNWLRSNENHAQPELMLDVFRPSTQWILGAAMLFIAVAGGCAFVLYQARIADDYPSQLSLSTLGVVCSATGLFIQMWCVKERGPVFVTAFNTLSTVLVAIFEPLLFHVPLHLGSLVGLVLVIGGLYSVIWGKALDQKVISGGTKVSEDETGSAQIAEPLLADSEDHTVTFQ
ncbi:WAT1-related protein [Acorus gramineus]|uniref:WAT1-related protein n=1 Tax=Acorus gramineus TaxID=55184 RepID=A0AAV9B9J5_ACOGR|nr:WAT1-related protein [Acorus gramineus]